MTLYSYEGGSPEEPTRESRFWPFLAGAIAGALAVAIAWWGASLVNPESTGEQPPAQRHSASLAGSRAGDRSASDDSAGTPYLARCREVFAAQRRPLRTAADSLSQWEVHIGAMNKLVTGAITLPQATQFWNQTRVGASRRLERAAAGRRTFDRRTARCPVLAASERLLPEERSCHRAVAARNRTLHLAATALSTWAVHVHHMEMLRTGEMTPEEATQMWLQSWHTGNDQVRAYRAAARKASGLTC
jgi:hypothetical protein